MLIPNEPSACYYLRQATTMCHASCHIFSQVSTDNHTYFCI